MGLFKKKDTTTGNSTASKKKKISKGTILCPYCGSVFTHDKVDFLTDIPTAHIDDKLARFWTMNGSGVPVSLMGRAMNLIIQSEINSGGVYGEGYDAVTVKVTNVRSENGMVSELEYVSISDGNITAYHPSRLRCCPDCHNILVANYGQYPVKFISVIGIRRAGKTVYLKQLLHNIRSYANKWGVDLEASMLRLDDPHAGWIKPNVPLPGSTPNNEFQVPYFVHVTSTDMHTGYRQNTTLVFYDIAGEAFDVDEYGQATVDRFGKYVYRSNAVILLVDMERQTDIVATTGNEGEVMGDVSLMAVPYFIKNRFNLNRIPLPYLAVAMTKCDDLAKANTQGTASGLSKRIQDVLSRVPPVPGCSGFNMGWYITAAPKIESLITDCHASFVNSIRGIWGSDCSFFAVESLGCEVDAVEKVVGGRSQTVQVPRGELNPKHVDDPLGWILNKMSIIDSYV